MIQSKMLLLWKHFPLKEQKNYKMLGTLSKAKYTFEALLRATEW